jgi:ElaB/YqjD/DUF883 family membrane-anchored ribosome-binding protein
MEVFMAQAHPANRGEVAEAVRHAAAKLSEDLSRTARDTQSAAAELTTALRHTAADFGEETLARARAATKAAQDNVRQHPIAWAAAAAGAGAVVGFLLANRR